MSGRNSSDKRKEKTREQCKRVDKDIWLYIFKVEKGSVYLKGQQLAPPHIRNAEDSRKYNPAPSSPTAPIWHIYIYRKFTPPASRVGPRHRPELDVIR